MRKRKRLIALLLTLALVMSFIPANIAKADMSFDVGVTFNGPWQVGEESVSADKSGEVALGFDDEISLTGFNSETMEAVLTGPNNFEATLIVDEEGKTSISTASVDSFPVNMDFIVRAKNSGGGNNNEAKIVFRGVDSFELYGSEYPYAALEYKNAENKTVKVYVQPLNSTTTLEKRTEDIRNGEEIIGQRDVLITSGGELTFAFPENPKSACYNEFINGQPTTAQPANLEVTYNTDYHQYESSLTTTVGSEYEVDIDFIGNGGNSQSGGNENEAKIVFRDVNSFDFYDEDDDVYAFLTYKNAENENVGVYVEPESGVTLQKRTEDIRSGEDIIGQRDVLITSGGNVVFYFEEEPKSACYNEFINGQPQTAQPENFIINYQEEWDEYYASLTTTVGSEYEVDLDFAGNGGGGGPQPGGNSTAKINISGMDYNGNPSWTGTPGYGHEKVTTYYDKYWFSTQFAINENGEHGNRTERWDMFSWEDNYTDEQFADATERYGTQVISYDKEDGAETVDISVFLGNWGDRIDAIKINDVDYSNQLHLDGDPTKPNIFDDEASMLRLFKDQGIYITIEDVPIKECEDDGIDDEYNIQIAASPNSNCYIGNFLWSQDDYYAPIEMGGIEPSDKYIGKSTLTLMDIYYQDGTFDPTQPQNEADGFAQLPFEEGWYKHIAVPENEKEYTNEEMPAIHYQLDRRGWNPETQSESGPSNSEMVMPTGTWVKMKIQPEQGYQVESFSGVNRNAGNVKILSDEADDACIFMFKIDSGNFHIGANVVPYENTADTEESEAVSAASVDLEVGTLDGGTAELSVEDIQINEQDAAPYKDALAGDADDYSIEAGLDLSLNEIYLKGGVQDKDSDAAWRTEVGNTAAGLAEPAEITLQLDDDIDLTRKNVQIVHKNDHGNDTVYEPVVVKEFDPETNAITFDAESFSDYAILTKEAAVPEGNKAKLRINTTLGVMSGDSAVFTYKDGDETVGVVKNYQAVALEAEKDDKNNVVSQFMYTTEPGDSGVRFAFEPAEYYKPQVLEGGKWVDIQPTPLLHGVKRYLYDVKGYELTPDGTPVTDVQFRFVCTRTYDLCFEVPSLTVGEGDNQMTADVVGVEGLENSDLEDGKVPANFDLYDFGAKSIITLSGYDPERMVVRVTANNDETGWVKILTPKKVGDNYEVSLGLFDDIPAESDMLLFSLVEKRNDQPGPDGGDNHGDDAVLAFPESSQITFNENTSTATVTYINNQGEDVAVTVKPTEGTMLYKRADPIFDDQGTGEQPPEPVGYVDVLVTNGGQLTFEFSEEPLYAGYYMDDDSRDANPRGIDINNKTATFATEKGHAYEVCLDFGGNGGFDYGDDARVRFHGAVDIKKNETTGAVTVTYLDDDDDEVYVTITAAEGVIDAVNVNNWYDEENDEEGTDYELYTTGGRLRIVFPNEPEHTFAFWSPVVEGQPGDPVDFVFDNFATTLDTELRVEYDVDISFRHEPEPPEPPHSDGTIKTNGIYCASNYPTIQAGISIEKSNPDDDVEYRWLAIDANNPVKWFEVSPWKLNNNWMSWTPEKSGSYVFVCYARVVGNEEESLIQSAFGTEYHKAIKAICQMPYDGGFLVGIESRDNPNNSYKYEMLVLDCNLLVQGDPNPWIYSTGKCGSLDNSLWTLWKPVYGYYWTLFRIYDENDNLIDEICYGFTNAN